MELASLQEAAVATFSVGDACRRSDSLKVVVVSDRGSVAEMRKWRREDVGVGRRGRLALAVGDGGIDYSVPPPCVFSRSA